MAFDLDDYNTVAERITELREKHPEASLRPVDPRNPFEILSIQDQTFVVYAAACYRTPDDKRPGIGVAWEPFPGKTQFTRDSELMNAETSAVGRAIVNALAADTNKGIASREEVRARSGGADTTSEGASVRPASSSPPKATQPQIRKIKAELARLGDPPAWYYDEEFHPLNTGMLKVEASKLIDRLVKEEAPPKAERRGPVPNPDDELEKPF